MDYSHIKIEWQGEILAIRGYGLQARRLLKPLIEGGATVKLIQDEDYIPPERRIQDKFWLDQLEKSKTLPDQPVRICYCLPNLYKPRQGAINIGYTMWETTCYPREWVPMINQMQGFWVGCNALKQSAINAGIKVPIDVVHATLDTSLWSIDGEVTNLAEIPEGTVKFLFVGDWIPRKNYQDLILSYSTAFNGHKDVALLIKTWSNQPGSEGRKNIENALRFYGDKLIGIDKPKIYLLTDMIEEEKIISLMRGTDVYASVSKGEGFDLPMCQAMSLGKLVVATDFLAHNDYMTVDNSIPVKFTMRPVHDAVAPLYHGYQWWSEPDILDMVSKLRVAYNLVKTDRAKDIGIKARQTIIDMFSEENNTPKLAKSIEKFIEAKDTKEKASDKILKAINPSSVIQLDPTKV